MTDQNPQAEPPIVRADSRRRVTLSKEVCTPGKMFFMRVGEDGEIVLTPAVAVPLGSLGLADDRPA